MKGKKTTLKQIFRGFSLCGEIEIVDGKIVKNTMRKIVFGVCSVCGCTDDDCSQCIEATGEPCIWANEEHTLCSRCAKSPNEEGK
jgi:hypothetical protein